MVLLCANSSTRLHFNHEQKRHLGDFVTPRSYNQRGRTSIWAADNDAFSGFNEDKYRRMLDRIAAASTPPQFVTLPDVVCNHEETLRLWGIWHRPLVWRNLNRAFVLQNGLEKWGWKGVPWDYIEAVFIGGDTAFKLGEFVREIVACAKSFRKWVHMGRVNSVKRMLYAKSIGCDSCDGSAMARFSTDTLIPMVRALDLGLTDTRNLRLMTMLHKFACQ